MKRIYADYAYGLGPRDGCWWDETIAAPDWPVLQDTLSVDVAIIGGGFTGLSAALTLAEAGTSVAVLEAQAPGWGASGRNGGFCCLGGSRLSDHALRRAFGEDGLLHYHATEKAAIDLVAQRLQTHGINADVHSEGETLLAHSRLAMVAMRAAHGSLVTRHGTGVRLHEKAELEAEGLGGAFFGGLTIPAGFALNPRKYLFGLGRAAQARGAALFQSTPVTQIRSDAGGVTLDTPRARVTCREAIIATNGYSSEDLPDWLAGRYLPMQSNVLVTRPLSEGELQAQGWTSDQASYDSRNLLHYFRLMPDRRFLFGMRGGLRSSPAAEARARVACRRDFERMFPAWSHVETPYAWSGMVCLSGTKAPYVGPVPGHAGVHVAMCYHGNGVAMGSWAGHQLARMLLAPDAARDLPPPMRVPLTRMPLGRARRALMPPAYLMMKAADLV